MKRIGICSGSCDPLHNGHLWLIDQGRKFFDELWVVVGSHPKKDHVWTKEERLTIVKHSCPWPNINFDVLSDNNNIVEFTKKIKRDQFTKKIKRDPGDTISLFRGIRNPKDTTYEAGIVYQIRKLTDNLPTFFMIPPPELTNLSSTQIREYASNPAFSNAEKFSIIEKLVPGPALEALQVKYFNLEEERGINMSSVNGHQMEMTDEKHLTFPHNPVESSVLGKMRANFNKLVSMGFLKFPEQVMAVQVRGMLDPFPYDVVVSQRFFLKRIKINAVKPLGKRYVPMSQSLGPILVDANTVLGNDTILGDLGPVIIIEGKHRWLDAKEAGEDTILAYVGEKAWTDNQDLLSADR